MKLDVHQGIQVEGIALNQDSNAITIFAFTSLIYAMEAMTVVMVQMKIPTCVVRT